MENRPSLSQYFGGSDVPPASQFFDEIGTSPSDMNQSIYLGDSEPPPPPVAPSQVQPSFPLQQDDPFAVPTISGPVAASSYSAIPAASLPDPSTFFDNIGPEPIAPPRGGLAPPLLIDTPDSSTTNAPVDKEADRRRDAWIPNEEARKVLLKAQSSPKGSFFPDRESLTMPGIVLEEELEDHLHSVIVQQLGVSSASSRSIVRAEHVARNEPGVRELLRAGCFRAAANLTAANLTAAGQGPGRMHRPTKHTPRTLQNWLTRFAIMVRIRLYEPLMKEAEPFGDLSKPDMFYQFYPDTYGDRPGSMAPFSLRLLIAELPAHVGKPGDSMDRLYAMLFVINKMIANLNEGKTEDGTGVITSEQDKTESLRLWNGRKTRVLHSVVNCAIALKDYRLASKVMKSLLADCPNATQKRAVASALCRVQLLAGNVPAAAEHVEDARQYRVQLCPTPDVREYMDLGLIDMGHGKYQEAYNNFLRAADQEPTNITVANNISVCLLYMGRLKESIAVLQKAIHSNPEKGLNESLLINLCTLYELESSKTQEKKLNLLRLLSKHKSDTLPNVKECLKLN